MAQKTRTTKTSSSSDAATMSRPTKAGRVAGVRRMTVPGTLPVWTSSPANSSPVLLVRVVRVDELEVHEARDHDEDHAHQRDDADPVLLQGDAEVHLVLL